VTAKTASPDPNVPPTHLQPATAAWFRNVTRNYVLEEHHVRLLTLAAQAYDRAEEARSEAPESHRRVRGTDQAGCSGGQFASSGTRCFIGSAHVAIACRRGLCASPEVGNAAAWTAVLGLLLREYGI